MIGKLLSHDTESRHKTGTLTLNIYMKFHTNYIDIYVIHCLSLEYITQPSFRRTQSIRVCSQDTRYILR